MATYFIVSDVHSYFDQMMEALNGQGFDINNKNHIFVSLGDLLDRGPDAVKCLDFVNNLPKDRKILIMGNHEELLCGAINRGYFESHDYHNKTNDTVWQITKQFNEDDALQEMKHNEKWITYLNSCVNYYETDNAIFVHGWIPCEVKRTDNGEGFNYSPFKGPGDWRNPIWGDEWANARWVNGMQAWSEGVRIEGKTIYCGHFHTSWGHAHLHNKGVEFAHDYMKIAVELGLLKEGALDEHFEPFIDDGICAVDACCAYSGKINCVKLGKQPKVITNETDD